MARIVPDGQEAQVPQVQDEQERPTIPLHFRHPWRSEGGRLQGKDCSQQSFCISTVPGGQMQEGTTPGKEEVELRREQQPRATQEQLPEQPSRGVKILDLILHYTSYSLRS